MLIPVLVLLTVFVLWAGRGGRAALSADVAAEEAAAAAALCCEEDTAGAVDREALVEDVLGARPGLEFLCVGGLRPDAPPDSGTGPEEFVREHWLDFEPGSGARTGGVGVLGVQFSCETDGAVAPLRGLFPTVTFHGQASEIVLRDPAPPDVGFAATVCATEGAGAQLVFTVDSSYVMPQDVMVQYRVLTAGTTATPGSDYQPLPIPTEVLFPSSTDELEIVVDLIDDSLYEVIETLALELVLLTDDTPERNWLPPAVAQLDAERVEADCEIEDDDPPPHLFLHDFNGTPCQVDEGGAEDFVVRLRDEHNSVFAPSASTVTVDVRTEDGDAMAGTDYTAVNTTLTFNPGDDTMPAPPLVVQTLDDTTMPEGEDTETFKVVLANESGAPLGSTAEATCEILDDEVRVTATDVAIDEGDQLTFSLSLNRDRAADITVAYRLIDYSLALVNPDAAPHKADRGAAPCSAGIDDYLEFDGMVTIPSSHPRVVNGVVVESVADFTVGTITIPSSHDRAVPVALPAVTTCEDALVEFDETFWLEIFIPRCPDPPVPGCINGGEAVVEDGEGAIGTIRNDDIPTVSIVADPATATGTEGQTSPLKFTVSVTVDGQPAQLTKDITVDYTVGGPTATATAPGLADADYAMSLDSATPAALSGTTLSGTLTFIAGPPAVTEHVFAAEILADYHAEGDETFALDLDNLTDPIGAAVFEDRDSDPITDDSHIEATIEDDPPPVLSVGDYRDPEGTPGSFMVSLANGRNEVVTVDYEITGDEVAGNGDTATAAGHPTKPADFDAVPSVSAVPAGSLSGTLTFAPGTTSDTVEVSLLHDTIVNEPDETLRLTLRDPNGAVLFDRDPNNSVDEPYGVGTITDVDSPELTVDDPGSDPANPVLEGQAMTFTVTLHRPRAGETVTVGYAVVSRSAKAGRDFAAVAPGMLTLDQSNPTRTVAVQTLTDKIAENAETLHLVLSGQSPSHVVLGDPVGAGTITNVNPAVVRVSNPTAEEGTDLGFEISLVDDLGRSATIIQNVTVEYHTADRTATAGDDYTAVTNGSHTFSAGTPAPRTVSVNTLTDRDNEDDETMALVLYVDPDDDAAVLGDTEGTGTIIDAGVPEISVGNTRAVEGGMLVFSVTLDRESGQPVTVHAQTEDMTAEAPGDYAGLDSTELQFAPGQRSLDVAVQSHSDHDYEPDEAFALVLSGPVSNGLIDRAVGIGTIAQPCVEVSDDQQRPPTLTFATGVSPGEQQELGVAEEGDTVVVEVELDQPLCTDGWLEFASYPGTAGHQDAQFRSYGTSNSGIRAGGLVRGTRIRTLDDALDEPDEEFTIGARWSHTFMPSHYHLEEVTTTATIIDDDPQPSLSIADASAIEGDPLSFDVTLDALSARSVAVEYRTIDVGSADADTDYAAVADWERLEIDPEQMTGTISVPTVGPDGISEADETFLVELRAPADANASIDDAVAVGTITEGGLPELRIADARADEGEELVFDVTLSEPAAQTVAISYRTLQRPEGAGAATTGDDYAPAPAGASVTIPVGARAAPIRVRAEADEVPEDDETFLVEITGAAGVSLADSSAVGTINGTVSCLDPEQGEGPPTMTVLPARARESDRFIEFTVTLSEPLCVPARLRVTTQNNTAQAGHDFSYINIGSAEIEALGDTWSVFVVVLDDDLHEDEETFEISIRWSDTAPLGTPVVMPAPYADAGAVYGTGTIIDDDARPTLAVAADRAEEGEALSLTIRLDRPTAETVTFDYETADGSVPAATAGADYAPVLDTATIPPGELSVTVTVRTIEDALFEADENVELRLSDLAGAEPDPGGDVAVGRIVDDDDPPAVSVSNPSADEGAALVFAVTLDAPAGRDASVSYSTRDGTATVGVDYTHTSGTLTFNTGETAKTVSVQSLSDEETEGSERFFLDLTSTELRFEDDIGTGTIRDVTQRRVSVSDAVVREGGALSFVVGFDGPPAGRDITVQFNTVAGTAEAGDDYSDAVESVPGVVRILAGRTSAAAQVRTVQDSLDEDLEQLRLVLSDPVGAVLAGSEAVGTIIDDDPEPLLSVDDPEATENGDGTPVVFTLRLSEESGRAVSVAYSTVDGTAQKDDDYLEAADVATIPAGARTVQVPVTLVNDDDGEEVERFRLELSDPSNARFGDSIGAATILDDDAPPQILIDNAAATYEAAGASVSFPVRLSRADPDTAVTVDYETEDATATAGDDYTASANTLTFTAGQTANTVVVDLVDDDIAEDTETFRLRLSNQSSNATIGNDSAVATILDDDALPKLSVSDAPIAAEGATAMFLVELSRSSAQAVTVAYATVVDPFGGDAAAIPGQDFEAVAATLTIPERSTSATVAVPLPDDALDEHTETFWLRLANPTGATVDDGTGIGAIADDDPLPQLTIGDSGATEGATIQFTVRLDAASGRTVTVPWTTAPSITGDPASPTDDFVSASGTLTFASGTTTANIDIVIVDDEVSEPDETFQIQLGQPANATVDDGVAVGAIVDDDGLPRISIAGAEVAEDDSPAIFVVTLSSLSSQTVTVDYATAEDTADAGDDYGTPSGEATGTLVIPAGLDTGEISVYVADDDEGEETETFQVTLSNAVNAVIAEGAGTAVGIILDDDGKPRLTVEDAEECEDGSSTADCEVRTCRYGFQHGGLTYEQYMECQTILADPGACPEGACTGNGTIDFVVRLSHASAEETSVRYTTFARGAADPRDYVASSGTLRIPAGATSASIPVVLVDDAIPEQDTEDFLLRLDNPNGLELEAAAAVGTIVDDDLPPSVSAAPFDGYANENDGFNYHRVTLSHSSDLTVSVGYYFDYVDNRSPYPGIDETPGTLTFAPGVVQQTITVPLYDNAVATYVPSKVFAYANTFYRIGLNNRVNASYGRGTGAGIVWDDETPPYVDSVAAQDALEGVGAAIFTITLNRFSDQAVTATYQTVDGTATAGSDYTATTETVTFPPGTITADVTVPILDDNVVESDESFTLRIINDARNSNLTVLAGPFSDGHGSGSGSVLIIDDDVLPGISVSDIAANENAGTVTFWVSLSRASATDVTVDYATADGTATAGSDYTAVDDTLTIPAGDTGAAVSVAIHDDATTESDETFELALSGAVGATITDGDATATIIEDDNLQTISISDRSNSENIGVYGRFIYFRADLGETATRSMSVGWEVLEVPSLGDEAATIGSDFLAPNRSGRLYILVGQSGRSLNFEIVADLVPERDERFLVVLSDAVGAVLDDSRAWGTILNDDLPIVSIADVGASESDDAVVFTLQLHEPGLDPASLQYTTRARPSAGDAAALPGDDYIETTGTLQIAAGETTATISVPIIGDSADELDETFLLELSAPSGLELRDSAAVGTITDDDPGWVIDDRGVWEDAGSMEFTVTRDHTSTSAVTLNYTVTGASAAGGVSCTAGVDYITPSGSVTLLPAETQAEISLTVCDDDVLEGSETLLIQLTGVPGRKLTGIGTIVDNDSGGCIDPENGSPARHLSFTAVEREREDIANLRFKPRISGNYCAGVRLQIAYRTADGTASAPADYTSVSSSAEFDASAGPDPVAVHVVNDTLAEDDEETLLFYVRWGDDMPAGWRALREVATQAVIIDDD